MHKTGERTEHQLVGAAGLDRQVGGGGGRLDGFDLEMEADQREDQALEILDQIVEAAQTVRVPALVAAFSNMDRGIDRSEKGQIVNLLAVAKAFVLINVLIQSLVDINEAADLAGGEADVLVPNDYLELLPAHPVRLRPQRIVLGHHLHDQHQYRAQDTMRELRNKF